MGFLKLNNVFGGEFTEDGRLRLATAPFWVIGSPGGMLPEFTTWGPKHPGQKQHSAVPEISKADYARCIEPVDKRHMNWIWSNCAQHAPFVNEQTSLFNQFGKYRGKTVLLVLCGPSAANMDEKLAPYRDHPDFYVATLNLSAKAVKDPDFFCCFEQLCPADYFDHLDPEKTMALTTPMQGSPLPHQGRLAEKWGGRNVFYSYMGDMRQPLDERWEGLPLLFSALHTAIAAMQALYHMGFSNILLAGADYSMANPTFCHDKPVIGEADWYFDGSKYNINGSGMGRCYYDGAPLRLFWGIDKSQCCATDQLITYMRCTEVCMQIIHESGVNIHNCSGQGILNAHTMPLDEALGNYLRPLDPPDQHQHAILPTDPQPVSTAETVGV